MDAGATPADGDGRPPPGRRVLITGVGGRLGGGLARRLEDAAAVEELHGVDVEAPRVGLARTEFLRAGLRDPAVGHLIDDVGIDTVVHTALAASPGAVGGRARMKDRNVIGTIRLLEACVDAGSVRSLVVRSSTAVYAGDRDAPTLLDEDDTPRTGPEEGFAGDLAEIEGEARAFARRSPEAAVTILRFANLLGPGRDGTLGRLLSLPMVPTVLGYDPRLQFCHVDDAVAVLARAVLEPAPGVFNVAGRGVVYLSQCVRRAGRLPAPVPGPLVGAAAALINGGRRRGLSPEQLRRLRSDCVVDITALRERFGYEPAYTTRQTLDAFLAGDRP